MRSLSLLLAAAAILFASGCQQKNDASPQSNLPETSASPAPPPAQLPTIDAPLTRRDLLLAAVEAASATATRTDDREQQRALAGRTFSLRIRWCAGDTAFQQQFDEGKRVLKVTLTPDIDRSSPMLAGIGSGKDEASGFWLPRPWMLAGGCSAQPSQPTAPIDAPEGATAPPDGHAAALPQPSPPAPPADVAARSAGAARGQAPPHMVGIVDWFRADDPRVGRNHRRSYAITRRLGDDEQPGAVELVIEGRLSALPNGKVIECAVSARDQAPPCLVSVSMDRVRLEGSGGKLLAEWSNS